MPALFEVETVLQPWGPPFEKKSEKAEFRVEENERFDAVSERLPEKLFTLLQLTLEKALVEYNRLYSLKGFEQPHNRQVWIQNNGAGKQFSYQWGNNGITKIVRFKGISFASAEKKAVATASEASAEAKKITDE